MRRNKDVGIDIGRVSLRAAHAGIFHQNPKTAAERRVVVLQRNALLQGHGLFPACLLGAGGEMTFALGGARSFLLRVAENAQAFEPRLLDEVEQRLEILLRFPGKADNEGGANDQTRHECGR